MKYTTPQHQTRIHYDRLSLSVSDALLPGRGGSARPESGAPCRGTSATLGALSAVVGGDFLARLLAVGRPMAPLETEPLLLMPLTAPSAPFTIPLATGGADSRSSAPTPFEVNLRFLRRGSAAVVHVEHTH